MREIFLAAYLRATIFRNSIATAKLDQKCNKAARLYTHFTRIRHYCDQRINYPR